LSILTVGSTKGGVGKSTIAMNIVVTKSLAGKEVLMVDSDEQRTATTFTNLRTKQLGASGYTAVCLYDEALDAQVPSMAAKYDEVVIDAGGRNTESLRAALAVSDTVLIPVQPRGADLWALTQMAKLIREAKKINKKLHSLVILNMADPASRDNEEAIEIIGGIVELELLPGMVVRRKAFSSSFSTAKGVVEYLPKDPKAIEELKALMEVVYHE
jgi:chromosome partitioning protein